MIVYFNRSLDIIGKDNKNCSEQTQLVCKLELFTIHVAD